MNINYPEAMQIEVRVASSEHRNIGLTILIERKYRENGFSLIWTKRITFGNIVTQNIVITSPYLHLLSAPHQGAVVLEVQTASLHQNTVH